jgi:hypothetical protein
VGLIAELVSFYPEKLMITIDDEKLEAAPGRTSSPTLSTAT